MKKNYELMFIINPETTEEERNTVIENIKNVLVGLEAEGIKVDVWGERKLAYPIQKKLTGFYVLLTYSVAGKALAEIERRINLTESIIRFMVVNKDA